MAVVIEELTTTLEIRDELEIRKLVRREVQEALQEEQRRSPGRDRHEVEPSDPGAAGRPVEL